MKVGIITQPLKGNYGGIIQNWALQQVLKKMGHDPITIDYMFSDTWTIWMKVNISRLLKQIVKPGKGFSYYAKNVVRSRMFDDFIKENIITTEKVHRYSERLIENYRLEALIVGSDQVWRPKYNYKALYDMFCGFAQHTGVKRISYAASFGTEEWEYKETQTEICRELVRNFDGVSVRESSGVDLCKRYFGIDAVQVLDPTFLLTKEDYCRLINDVEPMCDERSLAAYVLDPTADKINHINQTAKKQGLKPFVVSASRQALLTPKQWISIFRDAQYVVTDSFHGAVFSMIFEKPFETLGNETRGNARFKLIDELKSNNNIDELREKSLVWLKKVI